jgi:hypothetical protein
VTRSRWTLALAVLLGASGSPGAELVTGTLEIRYHLAPASAEDLQPSYQTTIWLEDAEGKLVRSLLVSEWLAWSGHNSKIVCPTWLAVADWENTPEEMFDAVTRPTPRLGDGALEVDLAPLGLTPGRYRYGVETHIVEGYNIVFSGEIELGKGSAANRAERRFVPEPYPEGEEILTGVEARFQP